MLASVPMGFPWIAFALQMAAGPALGSFIEGRSVDVTGSGVPAFVRIVDPETGDVRARVRAKSPALFGRGHWQGARTIPLDCACLADSGGTHAGLVHRRPYRGPGFLGHRVG